MMTWQVLIILIILTNLATATTCLLWRRQKHEHVWSAWSPWVVNTNYNHVKAIRSRSCEECGESLEQVAGRHDCDDADRWRKCTHLDSLIEDEMTRLKRMERELGI